MYIERSSSVKLKRVLVFVEVVAGRGEQDRVDRSETSSTRASRDALLVWYRFRCRLPITHGVLFILFTRWCCAWSAAQLGAFSNLIDPITATIVMHYVYLRVELRAVLIVVDDALLIVILRRSDAFFI